MGRYSFNQSQREALELEGLIFTEEEIGLDTMIRDRIMGEIEKQEKQQAQERAQKALQEKKRREQEREQRFPDLGSW